MWQHSFPPPPALIKFFETILSWPVNYLVVPIGASHISLWPPEIQTKEWEKKNKEQTNNMGLGQLKVQEGEFCNTTFPVYISTNAGVYFSRNFYQLQGMPTHLWPSSSLLIVVDSGLRTHLVCLPHCPWTLSHPTGPFCCPLSTAPQRHPSPTSFSRFLLPTAFSGVPLTTSGRVEDLDSKPFVLFRAKTDKGIVCLVDHPHSVTLVSDPPAYKRTTPYKVLSSSVHLFTFIPYRILESSILSNSFALWKRQP